MMNIDLFWANVRGDSKLKTDACSDGAPFPRQLSDGVQVRRSRRAARLPNARLPNARRSEKRIARPSAPGPPPSTPKNRVRTERVAAVSSSEFRRGHPEKGAGSNASGPPDAKRASTRLGHSEGKSVPTSWELAPRRRAQTSRLGFTQCPGSTSVGVSGRKTLYWRSYNACKRIEKLSN